MFQVLNTKTGEFSTDFGTISTDAGAKVIGAVTNAMIEGASKVKWDYLAVGAKDNITTRMSLYARISKRIAARMGLQCFVHKGAPGDYIENAIIMAPAAVVAQLKQDIGIQ